MIRTLAVAGLLMLCAACVLGQVAEPIASGPPPVEELAAEAERLYDQERTRELKAIALRMVTHYPDDARSWHWRGEAHIDDFEHEQAREAFERAVQIDPDMLRSRMRLVRIAHVLGLPGVEEVPSENPAAHPNASKQVASDLVDYCAGVLERDPEHREALLVRAEALAHIEEEEAAVAEARRAAELYPDDPQVLATLASMLRGVDRQDQEAVSLYERALELDPENVSIMVSATHALRALGEHESALQMAERAKRVNPAAPWPHVAAAFVYQNDLSDLDGALHEYRMALAVGPDIPQFREPQWINIAHAHLFLGTHEDALGTIDEAIADGIPAETLTEDMANLYRIMGRREDALAKYNEAIELGPKAVRCPAPVLHAMRARVLIKLERYEEAWRDLHRAEDLGLDMSHWRQQLSDQMPEPEREGEG